MKAKAGLRERAGWIAAVGVLAASNSVIAALYVMQLLDVHGEPFAGAALVAKLLIKVTLLLALKSWPLVASLLVAIAVGRLIAAPPVAPRREGLGGMRHV